MFINNRTWIIQKIFIEINSRWIVRSNRAQPTGLIGSDESVDPWSFFILGIHYDIGALRLLPEDFLDFCISRIIFYCCCSLHFIIQRIILIDGLDIYSDLLCHRDSKGKVSTNSTKRILRKEPHSSNPSGLQLKWLSALSLLIQVPFDRGSNFQYELYYHPIKV